MKTLAQTPGERMHVKVRARWKRPDGHRLILVGHDLHRAGPSGPYEYVWSCSDAMAVAYAESHGFRRTKNLTCLGGVTDSDVGVDLTARGAKLGEFDPATYQDPTLPKDRRLDFDAFGLFVERARRTPPVSILIATSGPVAYLRQLAKHRRAHRRAGQVGPQPRQTRSTPEDRKKNSKSLPGWLRVASCAACNRVVRGKDQPELPTDLRRGDHRLLSRIPVLARFRDRPYCPGCVPRPKTA